MMPFPPFSETQNLAVLNAMKSVALSGSSELSNREIQFINAANANFFPVDVSLSGLTATNAKKMAADFQLENERRSVIGFCALMALVNGVARKEQLRFLDELDAAFNLKSPELVAVHAISNQQIEQLTRILDRRSFGERMRLGYRRATPLRAFCQHGASRLGLPVKWLQKRYQGLASFGGDTLGRQYYEFVQDNGLAFPGAPGALGEHLVPHDLAHVLGGFGASPAEEILVVAFQSGCQEEGAFFSILNAWCLFHLGLSTSGARRVEITTEKLDPKSFFTELKRGSLCTVDFSGAWDFWPLLRQSIDEVRTRLGISPRVSTQAEVIA